MDIFSLVKNPPSNNDFTQIISIAKQNHWLSQYPPTIVTLKCKDCLHTKSGYHSFLAFPWPSWNDAWTKECVNLCITIFTKFSHISSCHYPDLLDQVKYDYGCKAHILFFDKRNIV